MHRMQSNTHLPMREASINHEPDDVLARPMRVVDVLQSLFQENVLKFVELLVREEVVDCVAGVQRVEQVGRSPVALREKPCE
eukprot:6208069-Pleurochrysis_carterae.AAC.1